MEDYNDKSLQTIYIIHNNVVVCLEQEELEMLLFPSKNRQPLDSDAVVWTDEDADAVVYFWRPLLQGADGVLIAPNDRVDLTKSAVRIPNLETYVNREELIYLFQQRYNTIALGVPKRNYEGLYPDHIDEMRMKKVEGKWIIEDEEGVDFIRTGLGMQRAMPRIVEEGIPLPPLEENVYNCYPISRMGLLRNWRMIDINTATRERTDTFVKEETEIDENGKIRKKPIPFVERDWGETFDVNNDVFMRALLTAERENRNIRIVRYENSYPIVINKNAIPTLKKYLQNGREEVFLEYREGMYHLTDLRVLPSSFPKSTIPPSEKFVITNKYGARREMSPTEAKEWMIRNESMRGMGNVIRGGTSHIELMDEGTVRASSMLSALPSDVLSHVSSFLPSQSSLRSVLPERSREIMVEQPLLPFISKFLNVQEITEEDYRKGRYDVEQSDIEQNMRYGDIRHLESTNWKLSHRSMLVIFGRGNDALLSSWDNVLLSPPLLERYVMLIKLHLLGRIKYCDVVLLYGTEYDKQKGLIYYYLNSLKDMNSEMLYLFLYWLLDNEKRLRELPLISQDKRQLQYPEWLLQNVYSNGLVNVVIDIIERNQYTPVSRIYYQYANIFVEHRLERERVLEAVRTLQANRYPSLPYTEHQYDIWNRDDYKTQLVRAFLLSSKNAFEQTEISFARMFGAGREEFEPYMLRETNIVIDLNHPLRNLRDLFVINSARREREYFIECVVIQYQEQIEEWVNRHPEIEDMPNRERERMLCVGLHSLFVESQFADSNSNAESSVAYTLKAMFNAIKIHYIDHFLGATLDLLKNKLKTLGIFDFIHINGDTDVHTQIVQAIDSLILEFFYESVLVINLGLIELKETIIVSEDSPVEYIPFECVDYLKDNLKELLYCSSEINDYIETEEITIEFPRSERGNSLEKRVRRCIDDLLSNEMGLANNRELYEVGTNIQDDITNNVENKQQADDIQRRIEDYETNVRQYLERLRNPRNVRRELFPVVRQEASDEEEAPIVVPLINRYRLLRNVLGTLYDEANLENDLFLKRGYDLNLFTHIDERYITEEKYRTVEEDIRDFEQIVRDFRALSEDEKQAYNQRANNIHYRWRFANQYLIHNDDVGLLADAENIFGRIGTNNLNNIENRLFNYEQAVMARLRERNGDEAVIPLARRIHALTTYHRNRLAGIYRIFPPNNLNDLRRDVRRALFNEENFPELEQNVIARENEMNALRIIENAIRERNPERIQNPRIMGLQARLRLLDPVNGGIAEQVEDEWQELDDELFNNLLYPDADEDALEARVVEFENRVREREREQARAQPNALAQRRDRLIQRVVRSLELLNVENNNRPLIVDGTRLLTRLRGLLNRAEVDDIERNIERFEELIRHRNG